MPKFDNFFSLNEISILAIALLDILQLEYLFIYLFQSSSSTIVNPSYI